MNIIYRNFILLKNSRTYNKLLTIFFLISWHHIALYFWRDFQVLFCFSFIFMYPTLWFVTFSGLKSFYILIVCSAWKSEALEGKELFDSLDDSGWWCKWHQRTSKRLKLRIISVLPLVPSCPIVCNKFGYFQRLFCILSISLKQAGMLMYREWNFTMLVWYSTWNLMFIGSF